LLEATLVARGATVVTVECYARRDLVPPPGQIESLVKSMKHNFAVMALSVETLDSLLKSFAGHEALLTSAWLLVPHPRVAAAAGARAFTRVAEVGMSAETLIPALIRLKPRIDAQAD
jgi:uroporphyrinogen-III synthase